MHIKFPTQRTQPNNNMLPGTQKYELPMCPTCHAHYIRIHRNIISSIILKHDLLMEVRSNVHLSVRFLKPSFKILLALAASILWNHQWLWLKECIHGTLTQGLTPLMHIRIYIIWKYCSGSWYRMNEEQIN